MSNYSFKNFSNNFNSTRRIEKVNRLLKYFNGGAPKKKKLLDLSGLKTTKNRPYDESNALFIYESLNNLGLSDVQISAILASIIEESGCNPHAVSPDGKFKGLLQWESSRIDNVFTDDILADITDLLDNNLYKTLDNISDRISWTHGGKGSGYNRAVDAYNAFKEATTVQGATHAFNRGYVRPTGGDESVKNRTAVAELIYKRIQTYKSDA